MRPPSWPPRTAICLDCRSALPAGAPCPAGHGRIARLDSDGGREELLTEVWGPRPVRERLRSMARAGAASGGCGGVLDGCGGCDLVGGDVGEVLIAVAVLFALGAVLWCLVAGVGALVRWWRARPRPAGALLPAAAEPATGRTGVVLAQAGLAADPLTGSPCVGFAASLEHRSGWLRRPAVMLRDGATLGFDVLLDSGERVRVPAGALRIDRAGARATRVDRMRLALYLGELDPARDRSDDLDPFLSNLMRAVQLRPGDRVELLGALRAQPLAGAAAGGYRDPAAGVLTPVGLPHLRCS